MCAGAITKYKPHMCFLPITRGIKTGNSTVRDSVGIQGDVCISISYNIPFFSVFLCERGAWEEKKFGVLTDEALLEQTKPVLTVLGITKHKLESKIII